MLRIEKPALKDYQIDLALTLAETGAFFFAPNLKLKDGRPTPYFVNIGAFNTGKLVSKLGNFFASMLVHANIANNIDVVVGPSYKGSSLACTTVSSLWQKDKIDIRFDYDRREIKSHGEASTRTSFFVNNSLQPDSKIFVVDDVGTSMTTKLELIDKINAEAKRKETQYSIIGVGLGVDRQQTTAIYREGKIVLKTRGVNAIEEFIKQTGIMVYHLIKITELISYLYYEKIEVKGGSAIKDEEALFKPISDKLIEDCQEYWDWYGVLEE
jgi:orotate phosphoribosyltransferase